ncbi:hypothetical protein CJ030_MR3G018267 [Morella rubra]|uniref:Uncharacterized protein n=1 Tax=Morella rubra TaxID=262757 RepID=A0A6A1W3E0_9ROSI|nr:hypothetical protein CJ030_MR3G018267 [Morella rubra]
MPRTRNATMCENEEARPSLSSTDHLSEPDYFFRSYEFVSMFYNEFSKRKVMWGGRKVNVSSLSDFVIEHLFVKQGGHREEVTFMDVFVIELLLKGKKFNLPYIILKHMEAACETKKNLPYGLMFIKIFRHFGIALSYREQDTLTKCEEFDIAVLIRMGYRKNSRSNWVPKNQDTNEDEDKEIPDIDDEDEDVVEAMESDLADDPPIIPSPTIVLDPTSSFDTRFIAFEERLTTMHEA